MRGVFLSVSALVVLGVFLAARRRAGPWESLFAAGLVATSWEVAYHARWIAPDMILTALVALYIAALLRVHEGKGCLISCALLAGLATGTKYTAGLLLLPILLFWWRTTPERQPRRLAGALAAFAGAFLDSTPGAVLQPVRFWRDIAFERFHYSVGHYGFGVDSSLEHLGLMLQWIGASLGSPYAPLALLVTFLALVGAVSSWRSDRLEAVLLLLVPVIWVLFFATQKVLFVRNLLPVAPFIALFAARGLTNIASSLPDRARALPGLLGACVLILNGSWMWDASASIRERQEASRDDLGELQRWLETERGERSVYFSEPLARELYAKLGVQPDWLIVDQAAPADLAAFRPAEVAVGAFPGDPTGTLKSNLPGCLVASFGPREVNWEWYTTWREPRIVVIERPFLEPLQRKSGSDD
jgi:4-amino-4-deoxy-L-arabinose transferase-like glycosyltransferase